MAAARQRRGALLNDPSPYIRGRAIYLLYQLGPEGRQRAGAPESHTDPALRIAAYRAMRRAGLDVVPVAARLARDADPGVRREVALSMRDQSAEKALGILVDIARGYDGKDRSYLEALGTGATGKEPALYDRLRASIGVKTIRPRGRPRFTGCLAAAVPRRSGPVGTGAVPKLSPRRAALRHGHSRSSRTPPRPRPCSVSLSRTTRCVSRRRCSVEPQSNDWADHGLRPALRRRNLRSRHIDAERSRGAAAAADLPSFLLREIARLTGDPHAVRPRRAAANVPCRRRHGRRPGAGTRWMGRASPRR